MTTRSAKVILELLVDKYIANAGKAAKATEQIAKAAEDTGKKTNQSADEQAKASQKQAKALQKQAEAAQTAGTALAGFGTLSVSALGASAKAAMDWESAWAGVTKTVDGSPEQMAALEGELRNLAKTLPSTHTEIAAVAEAAGQLGVRREDITKFTKTMIDLGETTNLTAEEAATDIAQIANVMGTTGDEIDNFGAALVALGNAGASTEKEILSMSQRIAGAGNLVGATESEVLALANTLASMGVKAELGGGVTTRVLLKMYSGIQENGTVLENFARVAGTSSQEFAKAFGESPVAALAMVTEGLGRMKDEGGNVTQALAAMGIEGTEETQVMLSLAGAGDLLTESLALGAKAWEENTALIAEASKRYETTESKVKVAWNNISDAAIDAGAVLLPIIADLAENVSNLGQMFGDLPAPVQGAVTGLGAVVGVAALVGGGALLLLPKIRDTVTAFKDLDTASDGSSRGLGRWAKAAGVASGALVGFEVLKGIHNSMQTGAVSTEQMTQALVGLGNKSDSIDSIFKDIGIKEFEGDITTAGAALNKVVNQDFNSAVESFGATVLGVDNGMAKISAAFEKSDQAIAGAVNSGNFEMASKGFKSIADGAAEYGIGLDKVGEKFPNYLNALREQANQAKVTVSDTELLEWAMGKVPPAMQAAADASGAAAEGLVQVKGAGGGAITISEDVAKALEEVGLRADGSVSQIDKFTQALLNTGLLQLSARDAARGWSQALLDLGLQADGTGGQIGALGTAFDNTTEQGIKNQAMFDGVAQAGMRNVQAMASNKASNEEVQGALKGTYDGLIAAAGQFGITGDAAVDLARDVLGVPDGVSIDSWMDDEAKRMAQATTGELDKIDGRSVTVTTRQVMIEERHRINYERRVEDSGGNEPEGGGLYGSYASGGAVYGPGTSTSDEAGLFRLSNGEHVLDAADVDKMGGQQAVYKFRQSLKAGMFEGRASGGAIGRPTSSRSLVAAAGVAPVLSLDGMVAIVQNPWTGEQVQAAVRVVAQQEAGAVVEAANRDIGRGRSV